MVLALAGCAADPPAGGTDRDSGTPRATSTDGGDEPGRAEGGADAAGHVAPEAGSRADAGGDASSPDANPPTPPPVEADAGASAPSPDAGGDVGDAAPGAADAGPSLPVPPGYPTGPYGTGVGDVVPPLSWHGHVDELATGLAADQPIAPYSMNDLRLSGRPYALVHLSEFLCPGCRNAATDLGLLGANVVSAGGAVAEVLGTRGFFSPASLSDVTAWATTYDLMVTTVTDLPEYPLATLNAFGVRETVVIIDLSTMEVIWRMSGDTGGCFPSSINAASTEILSRLGG